MKSSAQFSKRTHPLVARQLEAVDLCLVISLWDLFQEQVSVSVCWDVIWGQLGAKGTYHDRGM